MRTFLELIASGFVGGITSAILQLIIIDRARKAAEKHQSQELIEYKESLRTQSLELARAEVIKQRLEEFKKSG